MREEGPSLERYASPAEIADIAGQFATAARMSREAGMQVVEVHAAHGYLLSQFLSPLTNRRTDRWGGDLVGRSRFLVAVVRAIRARTRGGFALAVKLNTADFQRGGFDAEDSLRVARMPITSQVSLIETPAVARSRNPWTILGFDGSLESIPWRPRRVHTGVKLPKDFRPVNV